MKPNLITLEVQRFCSCNTCNSSTAIARSTSRSPLSGWVWDLLSCYVEFLLDARQWLLSAILSLWKGQKLHTVRSGEYGGYKMVWIWVSQKTAALLGTCDKAHSHCADWIVSPVFLLSGMFQTNQNGMIILFATCYIIKHPSDVMTVQTLIVP